MGIRESIEKNRAVSVTVSIVVLVVVVIALVWSSRDGNAAGTGGVGKAFYTVDDGATWFAADAANIPPFDYNGKQAVLCYVYKCGADGKPWVSHLMRYTAEARAQRGGEAAAGGDRSADRIGTENLLRGGIEVKEAGTGDKDWVRISDPRGAAIQQLKCPDGSTGEIIPLDPNG